MPSPEPQPLVSCIMPTYNRRPWLSRSIACFLAQDYTTSELIIVDDGTDSVSDLVPEHSRIHYHRLECRLSVGAKRNFACELATGDLIAHWDDDDWYPSWRLSRQTAALISSDAEICGSSELYFTHDVSQQVFRYAGLGPVPWVAGRTFMYRKSFWQHHQFPDVRVGEDTEFLAIVSAERIFDLRDARLCVASVHDRNTWPIDCTGPSWQVVMQEEVRQLVDEPPTSSTATAKRQPEEVSDDANI
jgi:glycosyltransferase involved in cell wall biosynthesis